MRSVPFRDRAGRSADAVSQALLAAGRLLSRAPATDDSRAVFQARKAVNDTRYRERWAHDKVVRSTHGVNCTGSCSWQVYVKDGLITWETQATDYPSTGPDRPEYEPRGCPRGASFSWYTYSPARVRHPYARGVLVEMYREARARLGDPVAAWAEVTGDPERRRRYQSARGRGGLVRIEWDEALEIAAAAHVHTLRTYGPDRIAGFSPIPAMSIASHAVGARFMALIGAPMISFYDWYADLPIASPQVFGDQTDVPESGDWWDAAYLVLWGSNVPVTRTPDAHWMAEARYRGQKVVVVCPDYADATKFADEWLHPHPGTDGAVAMAMGHVILTEFFVRRRVAYFTDYVKRFTDLPFLVELEQRGADAYVPGKFVTAADLGMETDSPARRWQPVLLDSVTGRPVAPNGTLADRWDKSGEGRWNLDLGDTDPVLTLYQEAGGPRVPVALPRFEHGPGEVLVRDVPVRRIGGRPVTTVFDLLLARYGVRRPGLGGRWPEGYDDASVPCTPAWQEEITSVPATAVTRVAREFARTAEQTRGRAMIVMGAGTNHWFHSDTIYRSFLSLLLLTGCQGVNGGGWAHYVGQEKVRPLAGWQQLSTAADWVRPSRQMAGTPYWYLHTGQWRYDTATPDALAAPTGRRLFAGRHTADLVAQSVRLGWMPSYPTFDTNPLDLGRAAHASGQDPARWAAARIAAGDLRFACQDPDAPANWPRVLTVWRANLIGSSAKGNEYFLRHLLGARDNATAPPLPPGRRPRDVVWRDEEPHGKLDLLLAVDFRMTSTTLHADLVLPAATWYEKHDLSSTDMHPYVHAFSPAISPPWQARTDFEIFHGLAAKLSELAAGRLERAYDLVATALGHDTPYEMAQPGGTVPDWRDDDRAAEAGHNLPHLTVVERDYTTVADRLAALGPLLEDDGMQVKGVTVRTGPETRWLAARCGTATAGSAAGRPLLDTDAKLCEAVLALSGTTNGRVAAEGFARLAERCGPASDFTELAESAHGHRVLFSDTQARPAQAGVSFEWSGKEGADRRYAPFTINTENLKPWHTLTGRQHFYLDHDWIAEFGEQLPVYRPPLDPLTLGGTPHQDEAPDGGRTVTVRYLTPHSKWSIHSEYQENLLMQTLARGGPVVWMSPADAEAVGAADNDWIEAVNPNGVVVARAVVSHRIPPGTVFMYHVQERLVNVPKSEATGRRGGVHNALTRLLVKPTHLIGGYAQLSFAPNYYGPTGNQRDAVTVIRRRSQNVEY
ncbi:nitrate reductase subunit alpha [Streptantibioticus cattleyicolor]|uniref:nitrate reductase (quinone) n=1 Tax=Streptantibioticus cattleyicolor (strain ATCC 35852 / DSM 46488 / JCM 4925 / NBRC 14057 / NRRL 8057) TaxID=1003195 RepID=F8JKL8_STREN|nr:nitrate reductase subunit alpha [Streptantibioticus cattleyicolor]AEW98491.1 nitrate reductase alpha chain NarG3 [Streptantibioticus cattleyicolor NRRL 8057 = DSM 46488]CCB72452.1 nitrate reductase (alpha subunit) [Streptantibioticus cattleyicolor NRRL 8057 = DSM 46488]